MIKNEDVAPMEVSAQKCSPPVFQVSLVGAEHSSFHIQSYICSLVHALVEKSDRGSARISLGKTESQSMSNTVSFNNSPSSCTQTD